MKNVIAWIIGTIIAVGILFAAFLWATSPEVWYAGQHDAKCEKTLRGEKCHCYERLVAADKEEERK